MEGCNRIESSLATSNIQILTQRRCRDVQSVTYPLVVPLCVVGRHGTSTRLIRSVGRGVKEKAEVSVIEGGKDELPVLWSSRDGMDYPSVDVRRDGKWRR